MAKNALAEPSVKLPEFFYDTRAGAYHLRSGPDRFIRLEKSDLKLHLRHAGLSAGKSDGQLNEVERAMLVSHLERSVDYAAPLAGHKAGVFTAANGLRVLVTQGQQRNFDSPKRKTFPFIEGFLTALFAESFDSFLFLLRWLHVADKGLTSGDFRPGQCAVFAGEAGCGKSFLCALITEFLGGRAVSPYQWLTGESAFNYQLAEAEHLPVDDQHGSIEFKRRQRTGDTIKNLTVAGDLDIFPKGGKPLKLPTFRRLSMFLNREPESMMVVPPLNEDLKGKFALCACSSATAALSEDRAENMRRLREDLPAFVAHVRAVKIPKGARDPRFGVAAYHDPGLLEILSETTPETRLLELIESCWPTEASGRKRTWTASALEIQERLLRTEFAFEVNKLLSFSSACGTYLARLAVKHPERIQRVKNKGKTVWKIARADD